MLPSAGRGDFAAPTVVTSRENDLATTIITARPETFVATTALETSLPATTLRATTVATTAAPDSTATTVAQEAETTAGATSAEFAEAPPVAVGIGDSLVITTARAVEGRTFITLTDGNGNPHEATVLMVDRDRGLAVLSADAAAVTTSYGIGPAAAAGDVVTVLGATPTAAKVMVGTDGHLTLDALAAVDTGGCPDRQRRRPAGRHLQPWLGRRPRSSASPTSRRCWHPRSRSPGPRGSGSTSPPTTKVLRRSTRSIPTGRRPRSVSPWATSSPPSMELPFTTSTN